MLSGKILRHLVLIWLILLVAGSTVCLSATRTEKTSRLLTHYMQGLISEWQEDTGRAIKEFQKARELDDESYAIHLHLGIDYAREGALKEAVEEFNIAAKLNPQDLQSHYYLALIYTSMKQNEAASQEYETILKGFSRLEPENTKVYFYLGELYFRQKKFDAAMKQFNQILNIEPQNLIALSALGMVFDAQGRKDEAIRYFREVITLDPENSDGLNSLGYIYAEQGKNLEEAEGLIKKALKIEPDNAAYLDSLGWVYFKRFLKSNDREFLQMAIKELARASTLWSDPTILMHLGEAYLKNGETVKAGEAWRKSLELDPGQKELIEKLEAIGSKDE